MQVNVWINLVTTSFLHDFLIYRQRFIDLCNGKIQKGAMTLMRDKSLRKTDAKGEYLYNKVG